VSPGAFKAAHRADGRDGGIGDAADGHFDAEGKRKKRGGDGEPGKRAKRVGMERWTSSAKIDRLCEILQSIRAEDPFAKVVVFSQVARLEGLANEVHGLP